MTLVDVVFNRQCMYVSVSMNVKTSTNENVLVDFWCKVDRIENWHDGLTAFLIHVFTKPFRNLFRSLNQIFHLYKLTSNNGPHTIDLGSGKSARLGSALACPPFHVPYSDADMSVSFAFPFQKAIVLTADRISSNLPKPFRKHRVYQIVRLQ